MNIWKHRRLVVIFIFDLLVIFAVSFLNRLSGLVGASTEILGTVVNPGGQERDPGARIVFMLTTGFEDLREVELCLSDLKMV